MVHEEFIRVLRKTYNLPDCLPPFPMFPKVVEALEVLNKQYPNDVQILQKLVSELKEENKRLSSS